MITRPRLTIGVSYLVPVKQTTNKQTKTNDTICYVNIGIESRGKKVMDSLYSGRVPKYFVSSRLANKYV